MAESEISVEAMVMRAVARAFEPYEKDFLELKHDLKQIKIDRERDTRYAEEDRRRLAADLKDESERHAEEIAEKVINRIMVSFGLNPKEPTDFVRLMGFVEGLQSTLNDARKHGLTVIVGLVTMGIAGLLWTALKGSLLK